MLFNYLKIAYRNLLRYKVTSFINLFGLTVGLSCCLLILAYILNEVSFDRYNKKADQVYRIHRTFRNAETGNISLELGTIAPAFGPLLLNDFKEIKTMTRMLPVGVTAVRYGEKMFNEKQAFFADEHLFDVFDVKMLEGGSHNSIEAPYSAIVTRDIANKYFGKEDPFGKILNIGNIDFRINGVYQSFPSNSHIHPGILLSFNTLRDSTVYGEENLRTNFGNNSFFTYILLPKGIDKKSIESRFPAFINRHPPYPAGKFKSSDWTSLSLMPLVDIHLYSHTDFEAEENGDIKRVYIFSAVALFILLIACINYMNLATARSALRAREIGVRKVVGARRKEIIIQFLTESVLISWIAIVLAFFITALCIPWVNKLSGSSLSFGILMRWEVLVPLLATPFVVGIASGIYPALFLSSFQPVKVLKGMLRMPGSFSFRQVLVVVQFTISIILIVSTIVVFRQLKYMQTKALGFDKDHIVNLNYNNALNGRFESFRAELLSSPQIVNAGRSSRIPTGRLLDESGSKIDRGDSLTPVSADIKYVTVDQDFISTYGIKVVAGREFSRDFGLDTAGFILNEAAVKTLGIASNEAAIGKKFSYGEQKGQLIGVIHDFHFESMHEKIVPLVLLIPTNESAYGNISVKMKGGNIPAALAQIEKTWKKFLPDAPFDYTFLDESFDHLYQAEQRQGSLFTFFACIAIFLACLGLFGLSAFAISQRLKEIGIRKVLGAGIDRIVTLLSKDFLKLVAIASVIAFPIAWFAMNRWLQDFAYRISVPWWAFLLAAFAAALVAFLTISIQAVKAAMANPVESLRSE